MNVLYLPAEVADSCREMASRLSTTARNDGSLIRAGSFVHRCYVRAVAPASSERAHDLRWRRFIGALDAYLRRCPDTSSPASRRLRSIVTENADLLDRQSALAS